MGIRIGCIGMATGKSKGSGGAVSAIGVQYGIGPSGPSGPQPGDGGGPLLASRRSASCETSAGCGPILNIELRECLSMGRHCPTALFCAGSIAQRLAGRSLGAAEACSSRSAGPLRACPPQAATRFKMLNRDIFNSSFFIFNCARMGAAARSRPRAEGCSYPSQARPLGCGLVLSKIDLVRGRLAGCSPKRKYAKRVQRPISF